MVKIWQRVKKAVAGARLWLYKRSRKAQTDTMLLCTAQIITAMKLSSELHDPATEYDAMTRLWMICNEVRDKAGLEKIKRGF